MPSNPENWFNEFHSYCEGGNPWLPKQSRKSLPGTFTSFDEAKQDLLKRGFHQTASYACGGNPKDFTQPIQTCLGNGQYRYQANIQDNSDHTIYSNLIQDPEPNPELTTYLPPSAPTALPLHWDKLKQLTPNFRNYIPTTLYNSQNINEVIELLDKENPEITLINPLIWPVFVMAYHLLV